MANQYVSQSVGGAEWQDVRLQCFLYNERMIAKLTTTSGLVSSESWTYTAAATSVRSTGAFAQPSWDDLMT